MAFDEPPFQNGENSEDEPRKTGRPKGSTKLDPCEDTFKQINGLARIQCTQREAAAVLGVHADTLRAFLNSHEKAMEAWEDGAETGKASLRRHQFKMSEHNATMAIWLGKQWLGQKDVTETTTTIIGSDEHLESRAAQLLGKAGIDLHPRGDGAPEEQA